ncbi:hypothetical protein PRIC2_009077 [Phytophthora ramorum]
MMHLLLVLCALLVASTAAFGRRAAASSEAGPPAVLWYAPFLSGGGYCSEAQSYVVAVDAALDSWSKSAPKRSISASSQAEAAEQSDAMPEQPFELLITQHGDSLNPSFIQDLSEGMKSTLELHWIQERDVSWRLQHRKIALAICHSEPGAWEPAHYMTSKCPPGGALYTVGRTMFETDRVPQGWPDRMNKMHEIWVPTKFQEKVFVDGGVRPEAVKVVPEVVDVAFFDPEKVETPYDLASETQFELTEHTTVYLSIFKWEERKAWKVLLTAYFQAFEAHEDVVLVLLTNGYHSSSSSAGDFMNKIEEFAVEAVGKKLHELPHLHVLPPHIPQEAMPALYKAANAFRPAVAGTTEYMTEENSYPLKIDGLIEITEGAFRGHMWADPSVEHLKELLLRVKEFPEEAAGKGKQAREDMVAKYSPEIVGEIILEHITRILEIVAAQEEAAASAGAHEEL